MAQREFMLGDQWIYYKLYCGINYADTVLVDYILPLTEKLKAEGIIQKWFFIKYIDDDFHIRLRFFCEKPEENLAKVILLMRHTMQPLIDQRFLWKVQLDSYKRELERYDGRCIDALESIFELDSNLILHFLQYNRQFADSENQRWLFAIQLINHYITLFGLQDEEKSRFADSVVRSFKQEFSLSKDNAKRINLKFKNHFPQIRTAISAMDPSDSTAQLLKYHADGFARLWPEVQQVYSAPLEDVNSYQLAFSLVHMSMNRLFRSSQRFQEMLCYDMLLKYYKSKAYA